MRVLFSMFSLCLMFIWATVAAAGCVAPSIFDTYPADRQNALRSAASDMEYSQGILWQVEKDGITSYLIGTMHFADARHDKTLARLSPLIDKVDQVYIEMTKPDETKMMAELTERPELFLIQEGPSLIDRLGEENWQKLQDDLQAIGLPAVMAARYQPWFLGMALSIPPCVMKDQQAGHFGLDRQIETMALAQDLPVTSLDDVEHLLNILTGTPLDEQVEVFRDTISFGISSHEGIGDLIALYFNEEIALTWEFTKDLAHSAAGPENAARVEAIFAEQEDLLVRDRNTLWMETLIASLTEKPTLVAVGALHLPGPDGLLTMLDEEGFEIKRLSLHAP